ncbi:hypothetical protein ABZX92_44930 [Lentzea sp. NPDC006480]|uniref:hypothetical protein n=1 Tax=Lentzea sp. NPDC006480 TaxID=3157176 RepID=UPI0033B0BE2E
MRVVAAQLQDGVDSAVRRAAELAQAHDLVDLFGVTNVLLTGSGDGDAAGRVLFGVMSTVTGPDAEAKAQVERIAQALELLAHAGHLEGFLTARPAVGTVHVPVLVQVVDGIAAELALAGRDDPAVVALVAAAGIAAQAQPADTDPADRADADPTSAEPATTASEPVFGQLVQTQPTEAVTGQAAQPGPDVWAMEDKPGGQNTGPVVLGSVKNLFGGDVRVPAGQVPHRLLRHNGLLVRLDLFPETQEVGLASWLERPEPVRVRVEEQHSRIWRRDERHYYWIPPVADGLSLRDVLVVGVLVTRGRAVIHVPGVGEVRVDGFSLAHLLQFFGALDGHRDGAVIFLAVIESVPREGESGHEQLAASLQVSLAELGHNRRVAIGTKPASMYEGELVVPDGGHVRIFGGAVDKEAVADELAAAHGQRWKYQPAANSGAGVFSLDDRMRVLALMTAADKETIGRSPAEAMLAAFRKLRSMAGPDVAGPDVVDVVLLAVAQKRYDVRTMAGLWSLLASAPVDVAELDEVRYLVPAYTVEPRDGRVGYDVRRVEVYPGVWMREVQLKIRLDFADDISPAQRAALWRNLVIGVDRAFDAKRPKGGDGFRVQVLRADADADAHVTVQIGGQAVLGTTWSVAARPEELGAHVADLLGGSDSRSIERLAAAEELGGVSYSQLREVADWNRRVVSGRDAAGRERRFPLADVHMVPLSSGDTRRGLVFPSLTGTWSPEVLDALAISGVQEVVLTEQGTDRTQGGPRVGGFDLVLVDTDQNTAVVTVESIGEVRLDGAAFASLVAGHLRDEFTSRPALLVTPFAGALNHAGGFAFDLAESLKGTLSEAIVAAATHGVVFDLALALKGTLAGAIVAAATHGAEVVLDRQGSSALVVSGGGHLNLFPASVSDDVAELRRSLEADWVYAPSEPKPGVELLSTSDRGATIALIKEMVKHTQAVVSENGGLVRLWTLLDLVKDRHDQPDLVVGETLRHISIAHPGLRDQITAVVELRRTGPEAGVEGRRAGGAAGAEPGPSRASAGGESREGTQAVRQALDQAGYGHLRPAVPEGGWTEDHYLQALTTAMTTGLLPAWDGTGERGLPSQAMRVPVEGGHRFPLGQRLYKLRQGVGVRGLSQEVLNVLAEVGYGHLVDAGPGRGTERRGGRFGLSRWVRYSTRVRGEGDPFTTTGKAEWDYVQGEVRRPVRLDGPGARTSPVWDFSALDTVFHFDTAAPKTDLWPAGQITDSSELDRLAILVAEILVEHSDPDRPLPVMQLTGYGPIALSEWNAEAEEEARAKGMQRASATLAELEERVRARVWVFKQQGAILAAGWTVQDFVRLVELAAVAEPWTADQAESARVKVKVVASETLVQERGDRGDVAALIKMKDTGVQLAHTMLVDLARQGNREALRLFLSRDETEMPALAELASADVAEAREQLRAMAREGSANAIGELTRAADIEGLVIAGTEAATSALFGLARDGNALAAQALLNQNPRDVPRLVTLAENGFAAAHTALVNLAKDGDNDAVAELVRIVDVAGLVAASLAGVNTARTALQILAVDRNPEALAAMPSVFDRWP